jgi:hypothetical protein
LGLGEGQDKTFPGELAEKKIAIRMLMQRGVRFFRKDVVHGT